MIKLTSILLFLLGFGLNVFSQTSESKVKAGLIFRFAQFVEWNDESAIDTFKFGLLTQDSILISDFIDISLSVTLRSKPITVFVKNEIADMNNMHCIFIDYDYRRSLDEVANHTKSKEVLIITYKSPKLLLSMINIYKPKNESTLKFEVNKQNLDDNGFIYKPDLLLYGGSLVDVKELYISTNEQLKTKALELDSINNDLIDLKAEEAKYQDQIEQMSDYMLTIREQVDDKEKEVTLLNYHISERDSNLRDLNTKLQNQKTQKQLLSKQLSAQNDSITKGEANLQNLNKELNNRRYQIAESENTINSQSIKIETQKKGLILATILGIALVVIVVLIIIALKTKRKLATRLKYLVKKRTKDLHDSQQYYFTLFENTPVAICEFDLSLFVEYIKATEKEDLSDDLVLEATKKIIINDTNFQTLELYDTISKQEFIEKYHLLFNQKSVPGLRNLFAKLLNNEIQFESEITRVSLKGDIKYLIQKTTVLPEGKSKYSKVLVSMLDITELKMYEQEILRHRNHLEELVKERTKEVFKLNENLHQTNEELNSKNEDLSEKNNQLNKQQLEISGLNNELIETNTLLEEQKEELLNTLSQLKDTQIQLIESEKMASLGMLTAGVAHEINNPINFISSGNQALEMIFEDIWKKIDELRLSKESSTTELSKKIKQFSKDIDNEDYYSMIREIIANMKMGVTRVTEIVNSLQIYSRKSDSDESYLNLHDSIENALIILENKYKHKTEIVKLFGDIPSIVSSSSKLNQVFVNIFSNAFDAIVKKGIVEIITNYIEKDKAVEIIIKDNGVGISENDLSKIFEPFYTTKEAGKGTGLGMYITYGIINQLKGTIKIESEISKGTQVTINLPVKN